MLRPQIACKSRAVKFVIYALFFDSDCVDLYAWAQWYYWNILQQKFIKK